MISLTTSLPNTSGVAILTGQGAAVLASELVRAGIVVGGHAGVTGKAAANAVSARLKARGSSQGTVSFLE